MFKEYQKGYLISLVLIFIYRYLANSESVGVGKYFGNWFLLVAPVMLIMSEALDI